MWNFLAVKFDKVQGNKIEMMIALGSEQFVKKLLFDGQMQPRKLYLIIVEWNST